MFDRRGAIGGAACWLWAELRVRVDGLGINLGTNGRRGFLIVPDNAHIAAWKDLEGY